MKKLVLLVFLGALIAFLPTQEASAQAHPDNLNWTPPANYPPAGARALDDVYLQGEFVEVGVNRAGSYGTDGPAPAGFHPQEFGIGWVADYDGNGWDVGTPPQSGDYFLPGTPLEQWVLEFNIGATEYNFINYGQGGLEQVTPANLDFVDNGSNQQAIWTGTATGGGNTVDVTATTLVEDELYFRTDIVITNNGPNTLSSVEYMRNVDPDQEQNITGDFTTRNYVLNQPGEPGNPDTALLVSEGLNYGIPMAYYSIDPRAKVSLTSGGLSEQNPDFVLDTPIAPTQAAPNVEDRGVCIAFREPTLAPGQSMTVRFYYLISQEVIDDPGQIDPPADVPLSDYAIYIAFALMVIFVATIIRFRRIG